MVEGVSDRTSLGYILSKIINNHKVQFRIIGTDITSDKYTTQKNAIEKVTGQINTFLDESKYRQSDIERIVHIVDTDGTYIPETSITQDTSITKWVYDEECIISNNIEATKKRNNNKVAVLNKLSTTPMLFRKKVPYKVFYFSCNLEHVLHDIRNAEDEKKDILAEEFVESFRGHEHDFLNFIGASDFTVTGEYKETWEFIKQGTNSLKRYSNFHLCFNEENEKHEE